MRRSLFALFAAVLAAATACAQTQPPAVPDQPFAQAGGEVIRESYRYIRDRYVRAVQVREFAIKGIGGLNLIDPAIAVAPAGNTVVISHQGKRVTALAAPTPQDYEAWADMTVAAIRAAATVSEPVRGASSERVHQAVIGAALASLDSFSRYTTPQDARDSRALRDGYGGIGITVQVVQNQIKIVAVMPGTPADQAGLRADDTIVRIDGQPISSTELLDIVGRLRGRIGTRVILTVTRADAPAPRDFPVVRRHINPNQLVYRREGTVAYVKLGRFTQGTARDLARQIQQARKDIGAGFNGFILDLRDDPGGLLDQAIAVSDLFMNDGRIVTTRGRHPESRQSYEARPGDVTGGVPMIVLVNGRSASSSEIVAAALQDSGRAVLIGSNSFGKGTVQTVFTLPNEGELVLTWSRFHAPSGYALEGLGVLPNVCTARRGVTVQTALRGLQIADPALTAAFRRWKTIETPDAKLAAPLRALCPAPQGATASTPGTDIDLDIAKAVLREPALYNRALALSQGAPSQGRNGATDIADPDE